MKYQKKYKGKISGDVEINIPGYIERKKLLKALGVTTKDGVVSFQSGDAIDLLIQLAEMARVHVLSVSLKVEGDDIKSYDALLEDSRCDKVIEEISGLILNGVSLGE